MFDLLAREPTWIDRLENRLASPSLRLRRPDVRRGCASPYAYLESWGYAPGLSWPAAYFKNALDEKK